jgi:hypothetical protein
MYTVTMILQVLTTMTCLYCLVHKLLVQLTQQVCKNSTYLKSSDNKVMLSVDHVLQQLSLNGCQTVACTIIISYCKCLQFERCERWRANGSVYSVTARANTIQCTCTLISALMFNFKKRL